MFDAQSQSTPTWDQLHALMATQALSTITSVFFFFQIVDFSMCFVPFYTHKQCLGSLKTEILKKTSMVDVFRNSSRRAETEFFGHDDADTYVRFVILSVCVCVCHYWRARTHLPSVCHLICVFRCVSMYGDYFWRRSKTNCFRFQIPFQKYPCTRGLGHWDILCLPWHTSS